MRIRTFASVLGALALATAPLAAQTSPCSGNGCFVNTTVSATVADQVELTLNSIATALGNPTLADFATGYKDASGPTATVRANRSWTVSVVGAAANFTAPWSKPASDLLWGTVAGTYGQNGGTSGDLFNGGATASSSQQIFYRTNWAIANDVPGNYSLVVKFTLSAP